MSSSSATALDSVHGRGTLRLLGAAGAGARLRAPAQRTSAAVRGLPTCRRPPAPATQDRQTVSRPDSVQQHVKWLQDFFVTFLMVLHLTPSCQETCENMVYASRSQASAKDDKGLATAGVAERFSEADAHAPTQSKAPLLRQGARCPLAWLQQKATSAQTRIFTEDMCRTANSGGVSAGNAGFRPLTVTAMMTCAHHSRSSSGGVGLSASATRRWASLWCLAMQRQASEASIITGDCQAV